MVFNDGVVTIAPATLTEADLRAAADEQSFRRGVEYVRAVSGLRLLDGRVMASVEGTEQYLVMLVKDAAGLRGECSCPYGRQGFFCKHCVAAGLAAVAATEVPAPRAGRAARGTGGGQAARGKGAGRAARGSTLTSWLDTLTSDELYGLVAEQAIDDAEWRCRLELRAAVAAGDAAAAGERIGRLLDRADPGSIGETEPGSYARLVREAALAIGALTNSAAAADAAAADANAADVAADVAERAIGAITRAAALIRDEHRVIGAEAVRIADLIAGRRPAAALAVYLRQIDSLRGENGERSCLLVTRLLEAARGCHRSLGTEGEFDAYLADLRERSQRNRRLIATLDKHGYG